MQIVINNNPVWITERTAYDFGKDELLEALGINRKTLVTEVDLCTLSRDIDALSGWYYATCSPGCLPDSSFFGPYSTKEEALLRAKAFYAD